MSSGAHDWRAAAARVARLEISIGPSLERMPPLDLRSTQGTGRKFGGAALCRMCGREKRIRPLTRHHLVPQSWFVSHSSERIKSMRNATANLIPLCRPCHDLVDNRDGIVRAEARKMLRRSLAQSEIAFAIHLRGREWLVAHYPEV